MEHIKAKTNKDVKPLVSATKLWICFDFFKFELPLAAVIDCKELACFNLDLSFLASGQSPARSCRTFQLRLLGGVKSLWRLTTAGMGGDEAHATMPHSGKQARGPTRSIACSRWRTRTSTLDLNFLAIVTHCVDGVILRLSVVAL
ncbi:hypothetical protein DFH08DRAFT_813409 [Mycena albidolilacea]|uniref:Uncharacterized protein n=1 Tax=Mycena albidolilacea TaxID=1033008 RepID=A0AAD7EKX8_9AGAR|nr:hypothetical protein DFH08DRAFT_813409 [Mycena albidolilacea]